MRLNIEIQELFRKPNIIAEIRYKRLNRLSHAIGIAKSIANAMLNWNLRGKRPVEKPNQRWIANSKKKLRQLGIDIFNGVALDKERRRIVCFIPMNLNVL